MIHFFLIVSTSTACTFLFVYGMNRWWGKIEFPVGMYKIHHSTHGIVLFLIGISFFSTILNPISGIGLGIFISHVIEEMYFKHLPFWKAFLVFITPKE